METLEFLLYISLLENSQRRQATIYVTFRMAEVQLFPCKTIGRTIYEHPLLLHAADSIAPKIINL